MEEGVRDRRLSGEDDEAALTGKLRMAQRLDQPVVEPDVVLGIGGGDLCGGGRVEPVELLRAVGDGREPGELVAVGLLRGTQSLQAGQVCGRYVELQDILLAGLPEPACAQEAGSVLGRSSTIPATRAPAARRCSCATS